jgi:hypothetical protein
MRLWARLAAGLAVLALTLAPAALAQRMVGVGGPESGWNSAPCSGHGRTEIGRCFCDDGWAGEACGAPEKPLDCGDHGKASHRRCVCEAGWKGRACQSAAVSCLHGKVDGGKCVCDAGWSGRSCATRAAG